MSKQLSCKVEAQHLLMHAESGAGAYLFRALRPNGQKDIHRERERERERYKDKVTVQMQT